MILVYFLLAMTAYCDWNDCVFSTGGKKFALMATRGLSINGTDQKVETYTYEVSLCANITAACTDIMTGADNNGAVYQFGTEPGGESVCWDVLSFWEKDSSGLTADPLQGDNAGKEGFSLYVTNGDPCKSQPRKTTINVVCSESYGPYQKKKGYVEGVQDTEDSCHFILTYETECACSKNFGKCSKAPPPGGFVNGGGFSGGWIFVIILCVSIFCYFLGGYAVLGYRSKDWSSESVPNKSFWARVPGWTKVGCMISGSWTMRKGKWLYAKARGKEVDDETFGDDDVEGE